MNTFPIPDELAAAYKGMGHAIAAVREGQVIVLFYLRDLLPDFSDGDDNGDGVPPDAVAERLTDLRLGPTIRHLEALGNITVGLCSSWEFVEL